MNKIFVSIASYRDPELKKTLADLLSKAKYPQNLTIAIAWQHSQEDEWDDLNDYQQDSRFKIIDIKYKESQGVCWARNQIQKLYENEEYYLQLDSHHRFKQNWDQLLKDNLNYLRCVGYEKPVLSAYLPSYSPKEETLLEEVWGLNIDRFLPEGPPFLRPYHIDNWKNLSQPVKARFISAHFIFTLGSFVKEVPYDPNLYFHGEETSLAVRAFTHGYDLFSPHFPVIYHEYTREGKKKHWDDSKDWSERDLKSYERFRKLFGMDPGCTSCQRKALRPYDFGTVRTLEDYEKYAGLKFETKQIHVETKNNQFPPLISNYEEGLCSFQKHCVDVYKESLPEEDYEYFIIAFLDEAGNDLYRKDADQNEIHSLFNENISDKFIHIWREYQDLKNPHSWRVWPYSKSKSWCDRIEQNIRYE
jgi:hypothetical protein